MAAKKVSLKLFIDKKGRRVLFAEVDKEFVDFLFTIFTLPLGAVVSLQKEGGGMAGSLPSLYKSIENLRVNHIFQPDESKRFLLEPMVFMPGAKGPLLLPNVGSTLRQFYRCSQSSYGCDSYVADDVSSICPHCKTKMNQIVTFIEPPSRESPSKEGSLKGAYMVMDDLEVKALSTIALVTLVSRFNVEEIGGIEEKVVDLGIDEGVKLLKACLQSKTVLTDVFLPAAKSIAKVDSACRGTSSPASSLSSSASSSSSSSTSSPPYLSPNSVSSDSSTNSKCSSESSLDSPSAASCSLPVSSTLSNLSNLSLLSSKTSNGPQIAGVNVNSQPCSKSTSVMSKIFSPSLAERRGSLSKSLKLPLWAENMRATYTPSSYLADEEDGVRINESTCSPCELDRIEDMLESKDAVISGEEDLTQSWRKHPLGKSLGTAVSNGMEESSSTPSNLMQPLVCRWPSLEKIATFGVADMNSKDAFAVFSPGLGKNENRILYFWVGSSFDHDKNQIRLDSNKELNDLKELDWNQVGCAALTQMGLPKDTAVKIVKEDEEPIELLALLSSL